MYGGVVLGVLGGVHYLIHKNIKVPVNADDVQKLSDMNVPHESIIDIQNSNEKNKFAIDNQDIKYVNPPTDVQRRTDDLNRPTDDLQRRTDELNIDDLQRRTDDLNMDLKVADEKPEFIDWDEILRAQDEDEQRTEIAEMLRKGKKKKKVKTPELPPEKTKTASEVQKFLADRGRARVVGGRRRTPTRR